MSHASDPTCPTCSYSFLGPAGTFTEAALAQVPEAAGKTWRAVNNVGEALADVVAGRSVAAMIAIENSVDGGVTATQDALANVPNLRIIGEYLVPVNFVLVARPGTTLADVHTVNAHPVAYAQCRTWLDDDAARPRPHPRVEQRRRRRRPARERATRMPRSRRPESSSTTTSPCSPTQHRRQPQRRHPVRARRAAPARIPAPTGADKTSLIVELPEDHSGALLEMLEQFATRGVNLSLIQSRPIGDALGRYRFVIDADGHILDERMADALLGLRRFSPNVIFLGSYPRADKRPIEFTERYDDEIFIEARDWLRGLIGQEPA